MKLGNHIHDIPMLLIRVVVGAIFVYAGWFKASNMDVTIQGFTQMFGAMGPFLAYLVAYVEIIGGVMLILGLWASYAAVPLAIIMLVVLFYLKVGAIFRTFNLPVFQTDLLLLVNLVVIFLKGSGRFALKPSGCGCCGTSCTCEPKSTRTESSVSYPNEGR